jgi:hypothetical protein
MKQILNRHKNSTLHSLLQRSRPNINLKIINQMHPPPSTSSKCLQNAALYYKYKPQNSAQMLNFFPLLHTQRAYLPSPSLNKLSILSVTRRTSGHILESSKQQIFLFPPAINTGCLTNLDPLLLLVSALKD